MLTYLLVQYQRNLEITSDSATAKVDHLQTNSSSTNGLRNNMVRCVTFGCPACVSADISDQLSELACSPGMFPHNSASSTNNDVTSIDTSTSELSKFCVPVVLNVVLRDDAIARITPRSLRRLLREVAVFRTEVFEHLEQDWRDVIQRAQTLWSPRNRRHHHHLHHSTRSTPLSSMTSGGAISQQHSSDSRKTTSGKTDIHRSRSGDINEKETQENEYDYDEIYSEEDKEYEALPELWLPGRVLHLYQHRGRFQAAQVRRTYPSLRRIELQTNIFADHKSRCIFEALLEARACSASTSATNSSNKSTLSSNTSLRSPPRWVAFNATDSCMCCGNAFTWHSTFRGEAQEYRERYNCRQCGDLVCGPCVSQRRAIPSLGILFPRRVCDRCVDKGDFAVLA